jgi:transposase-like protein
VVRNGHLPARSLLTGVGPIEVKQPRVRDRRSAEGGGERFTTKILPPYRRKTRAIEELIPWLYLKGISTNDFPEALASLVGAPGTAGGLSRRLIMNRHTQHLTIPVDDRSPN